MTASLYHRWGIAPSVDVRDSGPPGVRLRPRGRPVRTSGYARWNHLNRDVQTLGNARDRQQQLTGKRCPARVDRDSGSRCVGSAAYRIVEAFEGSASPRTSYDVLKLGYRL